MKLIHYAPVSELRHIHNHGISVSRKTGRLHGVYAAPLLDFPRTATQNWYRQLRSRCGRTDGSKHLGAVIFEIDDRELVYFFRDWVHNALGERTIVTARQAEALTFNLGRERNTPLSPEAFAIRIEVCGTIPSYDQPSYNLGLMEIVLPRAIRPEEIVAVIEPDFRHKKSASKTRRRDWLDSSD